MEQQAKFTVEIVQQKDLFQRGATAKRMLPAGIFGFKGQPIGPKSVIVDVVKR